LILAFLCVFLFLLSVVLSIALLTLFERKLLGAMQRRKGPNIVHLLQPICDAVKLILKEIVPVYKAEQLLYFIGPISMLALTFVVFFVYTPYYGLIFSDLNLGLLFILAVMALHVYGFIIAGWSSNSKYAFLGALRACSQMLGYELTSATVFLTFVFLTSFNVTMILFFQVNALYVWLWPLFILFFVCVLAETARVPFDLPEAESELVAGYNVEYASIAFALFFLSEYGNLIFSSFLLFCLFFGFFFQIKILFLQIWLFVAVLFLFIFI